LTSKTTDHVIEFHNQQLAITTPWVVFHKHYVVVLNHVLGKYRSVGSSVASNTISQYWV